MRVFSRAWCRSRLVNSLNHFNEISASASESVGYVQIIWDSSCTDSKTIPDRASDLFTHENGDFGMISVTERSFAASILKV